MKFLPEFEYLVPETLRQLSSLLRRYGSEARILAGGTDLLIGLKKQEILARYVLDIGRISELSAIRDEGSHVFVGATATHTRIAESDLVRREAPLLALAASSVGSVQIRNSGTIGGNIVNGSPAADTVPPLIALNAEAHIIRDGGERHVPLAALYLRSYETALAPDEFLAGVRFPKLPPGSGACFLKLGRRRALSVSRITVAVVLVLNREGSIREARICPGAVMPLPCRVGQAEETLLGSAPDSALFQRAGQRVAQEVVAMTGFRPSTPYKEPVLAHLVERALTIAAERCRRREG
jgi:CO/xanthine dehydrogenase FAD-binding subunit